MSNAVGADIDLVQGGGGNTSVKSEDGKRIWVKASGAALAEMDSSRGWAELDLRAVAGIIEDRRLRRCASAVRERGVRQRLQEAVIGPEGARPSVETSLHALLGRCVVHTHPVALNAILSSVDSEKVCARLLADVVKAPLYVPYVNPGFTLALDVAARVEAYREEHGKAPQVVLLENHGLFVAADSPNAALRWTRKIVEVAARWTELDDGDSPFAFISRTPTNGKSAAGSKRKSSRSGNSLDLRPAAIRGALLRGGAHPGCVRQDHSTLAARLLKRADFAEQAAKGAFTPDHIIYCGTYPLVLKAERPKGWADAIRRYRSKHGTDPRVLIVPRQAVFYSAEDIAQLQVVAEMYRAALATFALGRKAGGPRCLDRRAARFVENWEVDTFRNRLSQSAGKPLSGRIGWVTGAASGLGKGIALGMIEAGATVVGCDLDMEGLQELAAEQPVGRFLPSSCNVTSEESVAESIASSEAALGGVDFIVNAAGIAPSANLVDFPLAAWQKTLDINLTGYFLCAQQGARLLLAQDAGGGIINLTSKSGLDASKANSAYNATKAGEIHLMRGWALELGPAGIRVNCVAPGNVFKGSKIWNDEYIRICAKKKGIRPDEVIPYYTSLSPLAQEIEPVDIAKAVVWLLSEDARRVTGQTVVVDGGQVMVR